MRIKPRQSMLDLWRSAAEYSFRAGEWEPGGRADACSTSDAEQLLCLMYPASQIDAFKLDRPDETSSDVLRALAPLGGSREIPLELLSAITAYMERYSTDDGSPVFGGGSYLQARHSGDVLTADQLALDVVDSFSMSVSLSLSTLGFLKVFRKAVRRPALIDQVNALETLASRRLTAAMIGLLRSFTVHSFSPESNEGEILVRTTERAGAPVDRTVADLREDLAQIRAGLVELTVGSGGGEELENEEHLFECGWSWGVVKGASPVATEEPLRQPEGVAERRPFLYFTVVALDGILDLFSARTRILNLLTVEQQNLARSLQTRWDLTQQYWATIASFGSDRWPLEDIPWRTTDGRESDYYSLLVTSVTVEALVQNRAPDRDLARVARVLDELSVRGRITRRALEDDPAVEMHVPGVPMTLRGAEALGPEVVWSVADFATALLKRTARIASVASGTELRDRLLDLSDEVWDHLQRRRLTNGPAVGLWDEPKEVFSQVKPSEQTPSWYLTERVAECLVVVANLVDSPPLRNDGLLTTGQNLLIEADHLYSQELLHGAQSAGPSMRARLDQVGITLERARAIVRTKPGTAMAILLDVLRELDSLAAASEAGRS